MTAINQLLNPRKPWLWFVLTLVAIALLTLGSPPERSLGTNVRIVYLHGAWVWTALAAFAAASVTGLIGLITGRDIIQRWSLALGRTGLLFWISYLPLSMWAAQANWNGLFLAEPRWRVAFVFAIGGRILQIGLVLLESLTWAAGANLVYGVILFWVLNNTQAVMHPPSPILDSDAGRIQLFFFGLVFLCLAAAWQIARLWQGNAEISKP